MTTFAPPSTPEEAKEICDELGLPEDYFAEEVKKANPYHDQLGRFTFANHANFVSIGGVFDKQRDNANRRAGIFGPRKPTSITPLDTLLNKPKDSGRPYPLSVDDVRAELDELKAKGMRVHNSAEEFHLISGGKFSPKEAVQAFLGDANQDFNRATLRAKTEYGQATINFEAYQVKVHGAQSSLIERTLNFTTGEVHHDYLRLNREDEGSGATRKHFAAVIPLYKKMGMKEITLSANLELGAYAWARYGFKTPTPRAFKETVEGQMNDAVLGKKLSPEETAEFKGLKALLRENINSHSLPKLFTDANTPHLDAMARRGQIFPRVPGAGTQEAQLKRQRFAKSMLYNKTWGGFLKLDDSESMSRMNDYLSGGKKV
jgi:hypothetical protein